MEPSNGQSTLRILVVDDFAPWRAQAREILQKHHWAVVGEAGDGLEAIEKANQLQPDIVILDISLPGCNGIEAAKQIRRQYPHTKIIFLSQQTDREIIEAALAMGGTAYILKHNASDLPAAVVAVQATRAAVPFTH